MHVHVRVGVGVRVRVRVRVLRVRVRVHMRKVRVRALGRKLGSLTRTAERMLKGRARSPAVQEGGLSPCGSGRSRQAPLRSRQAESPTDCKTRFDTGHTVPGRRSRCCCCTGCGMCILRVPRQCHGRGAVGERMIIFLLTCNVHEIKLHRNPRWEGMGREREGLGGAHVPSGMCTACQVRHWWGWDTRPRTGEVGYITPQKELLKVPRVSAHCGEGLNPGRGVPVCRRAR